MMRVVHRSFRLLLLAVLLLPGLALRAQVTALTSSGPVQGTTLNAWFIDVGQGNCVLIKTPDNKFMLYDAGSTSSWINPDTIAAKIHAYTGGADITTIILSHPDADHINIIPYIAEARRPLYVHFSGSVNNYTSVIGGWLRSLPGTTQLITYGSYYSSTKPSKQVDVGPLTDVYILAANVPGDPNTQSIVASVDYGGSTIMLTGDATATTERWIMQNWSKSALESTVYSFGHHGSNHSNTPAFLQAVNPRIGIFSASAAHRGYGHPRCVLVDYVEKLVDKDGRNGISIAMHRIDCFVNRQYVTEENNLGVFLTATQGNIKFTGDPSDYSIIVDRLR